MHIARYVEGWYRHELVGEWSEATRIASEASILQAARHMQTMPESGPSLSHRCCHGAGTIDVLPSWSPLPHEKEPSLASVVVKDIPGPFRLST